MTHRRRGIFAADAIMGLAIVLILAGALAVAATKQQRALERLAQSRAATRLAEQAITALQTGQPLPTPPAEMKLDVHNVDASAPAGRYAWVEVRVSYGRQGAVRLAGVVRADAAKGATP